jgi:hypothetical protein
MFSPQFFKESISNVGIVVLGGHFLTQIFPSSVPGLTTVCYFVCIYLDRESLTLHTVLVDSWEQCKDADVLLESPSAMAGVHIAEALRTLLPSVQESRFDPCADIPYFRTFTMPWTKYVFSFMNSFSENLTYRSQDSGVSSRFPGSAGRVAHIQCCVVRGFF